LQRGRDLQQRFFALTVRAAATMPTVAGVR
jgi:hypothetical protein